jgi:dynein heavy chain
VGLFQVWFSEAMFSDTFNFYKGYTISKAKKLEDIRAHIANLPNLDNPQAFGLHPNADITYVIQTQCLLRLKVHLWIVPNI